MSYIEENRESSRPSPIYPDMMQVVVPSAQTTLRYAGFWIRLVAYFIDYILVQIVVVFAAGLIGGIIGFIVAANGGKVNESLSGLLGALIGIVIIFLYNSLIPASKWQATPGKKIVGIYIIRTDGRKLSFGLALARYLAYIPSSLILGFGFLMIGWSDQKKGLHDIICKTRVVHGKPQVRDLSAVFE